MKTHAEPKTQTPSRTPATPVPNALTYQAQLRNALLRAGVQPRLEIGAVNDPLEREADAAAERVMRMPFHAAQANLAQTKASPTSTTQPSPQLESSLNSLNSGGMPLNATTRAFFEPRFGQDFSQVRLHTDANAAQMAESLNARAFTLGKDIAFGANQYSGGTSAGRGLLGHELAHVVQQSSGESSGLQRQAVIDPDGPGNPGTFLRIEVFNGKDYARFKAKDGTWVSASLLKLGYDRLYDSSTAYGAYKGFVLDSSYRVMRNPDMIRSGDEFLVPVPPQQNQTPQMSHNVQGQNNGIRSVFVRNLSTPEEQGLSGRLAVKNTNIKNWSKNDNCANLCTSNTNAMGGVFLSRGALSNTNATGGVFVCQGELWACSRDDPTLANVTARRIASQCGLEHEKEHPKNFQNFEFDILTGQAKISIDPDRRKSECGAYQVERDCLLNEIGKCGVDNLCRRELIQRAGIADSQTWLLCTSRDPKATLKKGDSGGDSGVIQLKIVLDLLRENLTKFDDIFDADTERCVQNFQGKNGLPVNGIVDQATKIKMLDRLGL